MLAFQKAVFFVCPVFFVCQKNSQQVFLLASRAKKLSVSFFLALLALHTKNSRPRVGRELAGSEGG
jgi:hypothetical protein